MRPLVQRTRLRIRRWLEEPHSPLWRGALLVGISIACALLLVTEGGTTPPLKAGDIAPRTVWATDTYRILDEDLTAEKRREAERGARAVYDFDGAAQGQAIARLAAAFEGARAVDASASAKGKPAADRAELFAQAAGITPGPWLARLDKAGFDPQIERGAVTLLRSLADRRIVARSDLLAADLEAGIVVRSVSADPVAAGADGPAERVLRGAEAALDIDSARSMIAERGTLLIDSERSARRDLAVAIASHALRPNLTYNAAETERRRQRAREGVNEVHVVLQKGRAVVEAGHEVTEQEAKLLAAMREQDREQAAIAPLAGFALFLVSGSILGGVWAFGHRYMKRVPQSARDLAVLGSLVILGLAFAQGAQALAGSLADNGAGLSPSAVRFAVPVAATAIVAALLFGAEGAALVSICTALLTGLALDGDLRATIYVFLGSISAAGVLALPQRRSDLLKAGLAAALTQTALVVAFGLHDPEGLSSTVGLGSLAMVAALSGVLSGILALGMLPVYESFGYLTNFKLLELASLGNPLLKELSMQAPGTYQHSVVVGSLAESAAESIGANPLFARVACYYHDIGKMKKPQYFIENQAGGENVHERLTPSMSALVVESHVKDGIEMGLAHGLPRAIVDVIPQHHGTRLISFFYNKAKKHAEEHPDDSSEVVEGDFRYPGPKPQTPEAGIIMLADGVEAATRSIQEPTPAKVHAMVQKVFGLVQADGQLDECDLSLKDLAVIGAAFEKVLLAIHHRRVSYPATADISGVIQMRR